MKPLIAISSDASVSAESSGTIEVVTGVSSNGNVSLSAVEVSILINDVDSAHNSYTQESSALRSSMELAQDIITFRKVKTVATVQGFKPPQCRNAAGVREHR